MVAGILTQYSGRGCTCVVYKYLEAQTPLDVLAMKVRSQGDGEILRVVSPYWGQSGID